MRPVAGKKARCGGCDPTRVRVPNKAKQTEMSAFGAGKGLLQGQARRTGGSCLKTPNSPMVFREKFLMGKIWGKCCQVCDSLCDWLEGR